MYKERDGTIFITGNGTDTYKPGETGVINNFLANLASRQTSKGVVHMISQSKPNLLK